MKEELKSRINPTIEDSIKIGGYYYATDVDSHRDHVITRVKVLNKTPDLVIVESIERTKAVQYKSILAPIIRPWWRKALFFISPLI